MSSIKPKTGNCKKEYCSYLGVLIGGFCKNHYWKYRQNINSTKKQNLEKKEVKKEFSVFFANQLKENPEFCEECGVSLRASKAINPRSVIAHILPKRKSCFPSVATHLDNRLFLCVDCHSNYDNKGWDYVSQMKVFELAKERLALFIDCLTEFELNKLPEIFKQQ